jgi:hypothetical protein
MGPTATDLEGQAPGLLGEVAGTGVGRCGAELIQSGPLEKGGLGKGQVVVEDESGGYQHDPTAGQPVQRPEGENGQRETDGGDHGSGHPPGVQKEDRANGRASDGHSGGQGAED